jgi:hypothetical protein
MKTKKDTQMTHITDSIAALLDREIKYEAQKIHSEIAPSLSAEDAVVNAKPNKYHDFHNILTFSCESRTPIIGNTRKNICRWMYKIVDIYSFERNVVPIGMSYLDRYALKFPSDCGLRERCQLVALTSLYIAVKLHDAKRNGTIAFFAKLSQGCFTIYDIQKVEERILHGLDWLMNPPTPQSFLFVFVNLTSFIIPQFDRSLIKHIYEVANYVSELSFVHTAGNRTKASTLACASFLIAVREANENIIPNGYKSVIVCRILSIGLATEEEIAILVDSIVSTISKNTGCRMNLKKIFKVLAPS